MNNEENGANAELAKAWELLESGDVPGVLRHLRFTSADLPLTDLAEIMQRAAAGAGFEDLEQAAAAVAADPTEVKALYDFGYACIERAVGFLAVPALRAALDLAPDSNGVLREFVAALESEQLHTEAVSVLLERDEALPAWPERYLLVYNALMDGQLELAEAQYARLPEPEDERWAPARGRVGRIIERAAAVRPASTLDRQDLRGWHFVLTGGFLATLSPYGFNEGMTGRYAFLQDSFGQCLNGLRRLRLILDTAGVRPGSVSLLPDRSSQILGLAAAQFLGLPARPYEPGSQDTLIVAYDLAEVDPEVLVTLRERVPGQVLFEHVTCWTNPPAVPADISTLLVQTIIEPWGEGRMRQGPDNTMERIPADARPVEDLVAEVLGATEEADGVDAAWEGEGADGETPDTDSSEQVLTGFVTAMAGNWLIGPRGRVNSAGPVRSSRFL